MSYGWFSYSRNPRQTFRESYLPRAAGDPRIIVWRTAQETFVIDDDLTGQYTEISGFTEGAIDASLAFAKAMGWLASDAEVAVRDASVVSA
ncbi:hypothetical protein ACQP2P_16255 [Dactylosporangium sp. CA-139114]|uniref:hypothetical protein n=1 Tax=Dactylosporangium sp. CA-139114 TaxID=3239931 RepID=UPI003D996D92